jgi:crotonobetainyl-CoA:carnitine CoA-transferase CaiB-like acyl-CoA transferase
MPRNYPRFVEASGMAEFGDERFQTARSRLEHNDELEAVVHRWAGSQDAMTLYHAAGAARAPVAAVHTLGDLLASPHLRERAYFRKVDHPVAGEHLQPGPPFLSEEVAWEDGRAPLLGEHNEDIYCEEMGLAARDLARLRAAGAV